MIMEKNEIGGAFARSVDLVAANAHSAINKSAEVAHPAVEQIAAGVHQVMDKVSHAATHTAQVIDAKSRALLLVQARVANTCRATVIEKPLTTLVIALGAGFALSWLLRQLPIGRSAP
jgi:ElaB/YqjD/DUF883 family membrane-anchored ribosome-binding protein